MNKRASTPLQILKDSHKKFVTGFTFTEVIVSALIIAMLAAGMFSAFVGAQRIFSRSRHRMQAFNFAGEAQDRLRCNYGYTDSQMSEGNGHTESEIGAIIKGEMTNFNTALTYDVSYDLAAANPDGYKKVTVRVTWDEPAF